MKKNIFICTLLISYFFNVTSKQENNFSNSSEKPNKSKIINPLPQEAYQHIYELFKNDFSTADSEFMMFLQNRYKKNKEEKNLEEEHKLIEAFCKNFTNNKNLTSKDLPKCAFAACVESLYFHQLIADIRTYPNNYLLAPFEQNYNFKLYPTTPIAFLLLKGSLPATQTVLYKQTAIRNFAKFLLITLSRR
jgi:hypothetical protein